MAFRPIAEHDLHVGQTVPWYPLGASVEVTQQCSQCGATFMAISRPRAHREDAVSDCAQVLNDAGWRFADNMGPLCPGCSDRLGRS